MSQKEQKPCNVLAWLDMEMSGLEPEKDVILEVAVIVTNEQLDHIADPLEWIIGQPAEFFPKMNPWSQEHHSKSGLWNKVVSSTTAVEQSEAEILALLHKFERAPKQVILCGNSIWQDRRFICRYMPKLDEYLHYRMLDVSSLKELARRWYPEEFSKTPPKRDRHRALDDILDSIEELRYYDQSILKRRNESLP